MNDYISRQTAIDDICETANDFQDVLIPVYYMGLIKALPAADVVPVIHGHWIRHDDADIVEGYYVPEYECSECKSWVKDDTDFCPHCGAKMDGGEEHEAD